MSRHSCWVCDDHGGLYVLVDISSAGSNNLSVKSPWIKVDSGFKNVYAGHSGLVCGIKNRCLHIRKSVTDRVPQGTSWAVHECDVLKIMPGKTCVVRKSSTGHLHAVKGDLYLEVLDWHSIPLHGGNSQEQPHYVIDDNDRLLSISCNGTVFCWELLITDPYWYPIAAPPKLVGNRGIVSRLFSNLWRMNGDSDSNQEWVSLVSFGVGCLWCLRDGTKEVWQLVIVWINGDPKTNWTKVELPLSDEESIVSLSASKSSKNGLYAILKGDGYFKMVSYIFASAGSCDRISINLPNRYPCRSMAICCNPTAVGTNTPTANGCDPSRAARKRSAPLGDEPLTKKPKEEDCKTKEPRAPKRGTSLGDQDKPLSKIPKAWEHWKVEDRHACQHEGVQVTIRTLLPTEKFEVKLADTLSIEEIHEKFQYDFSEEQRIINE